MLNETPRAYGGPVVPSGAKARADLLRQADQILKDADGKAPPVEPSREQDPQRRGLVCYEAAEAEGVLTLARTDYAVRPGAQKLPVEPKAPWAASDTADDSEAVEDLLSGDPAFTGLTESERQLLMLLLDGRSVMGEFLPGIATALGINHEAAKKRWQRLRKKILPAVEDARSDWEAISAIRELATV